MLRPGEAAGAVRAFLHAYLTERDLRQATGLLTKDVCWIGTQNAEPVFGRAEAERALARALAQAPGPCLLKYGQVRERPANDGLTMVFLTAAVCPGENREAETRLCVTASCVTDGDGACRAASVHLSAAQDRRERGERFSAPSPEPTALDRRLGSKALELLGKSIPGGMMGGYLEPGFPLYYINDRMLSYLGYTYEAFERAIDGMVINCMHPDDRERVDALVRDAFRLGKDYEVQYRIQKKDGSYIWVNDIGKKWMAEEGREACISVIRDISAEMEFRERLERQAAEQKRQALQYNRLFQSVLCGIVQYRLSDTGVTFVRANQEAIRIFGYEPEAFWAKRDWDLALLVAEEDRDRILTEVSKLRKVGDKSAYEYRLLQRDGTPLWIIGSAEIIPDGEGEQLIQSVFLDIDSRKKAEYHNRRLAEQVAASNEILRMALEHTTTCEFYFYPQTALCEVPERTRAYYHCRERYENMPYSFAEDQVGEKYRPAFFEMYARIRRGERTASCEFRGVSERRWCRVTLSVILAGEGQEPQLVVGIAEDITRQKEMEEALQEARSRDSLTGLYNKECGLRLVQECLLARKGQNDHCVMMLLDMDDFEDINQKEGSVFADAVLQEVSDLLRAELGPDNLLLRLGGDEFMLLVKHCDKARAGIVGPRIAGLARGILINAEKDIRVSVSIGMCSTEVVEDYNALYRCAESTLKYVKEHGKGRAACYLDTSNELGVFLTQLYTDEHPVNAIDRENPYSEKDLVSFALNLLGKSKNLNDAVFLLLSRIGKTFGFDRVSIIEANQAFLSYRFSYQWARNRNDLQMGRDFYASSEDFERCANMYDADGLADHNVREGISRFPSCLHAGIWDYGEYAGSMSFEVDREGYQWTREQRELLKELVKIVPSFIMKSKADAVSQAKTDFLSRMSHEIRTPMNAISGMTTIAKSVLDDRAKALDCLEKIESANAYLLDLINDILDMSRIESGKLELNYAPADLSRQLDGLEALLRPQAAAKGLDLRFHNGFQAGNPLLADSLRLQQVLVNLIGNAIKFTDKGGVTVRVQAVETAPRAVLLFSVSDTGIGIEPAAMRRIFNSFEQAGPDTSSRYGGTGLGLSISYRLVQMMGGTLEVRSEAGRGSEFYFTLSFEYAGEEQAAALPERGPERTDFEGCRILLAEDNGLNREIAQTILEMHGFSVTCAADGREAVERFSEGEPGQYSAILMDIRMPVMDGLEATRRIRTSRRPDARSVPIIALTANAFDEDTKKSMASGMNGHLSKPLQVDRMLELLGAYIDRREGQSQGR